MSVYDHPLWGSQGLPMNVRELARIIHDELFYIWSTSGDQEACGFIFPRGVVYQLENVAPDPGVEYLIGADQVADAIQLFGTRPVAVWHTHQKKDASPSRADIQQLEVLSRVNKNPVMFIYGRDGLRAWTHSWDNDSLTEVALDLPGAP